MSWEQILALTGITVVALMELGRTRILGRAADRLPPEARALLDTSLRPRPDQRKIPALRPYCVAFDAFRVAQSLAIGVSLLAIWLILTKA